MTNSDPCRAEPPAELSAHDEAAYADDAARDAALYRKPGATADGAKR